MNLYFMTIRTMYNAIASAMGGTNQHASLGRLPR